MDRENFILLTDSYKPTHWLQYPSGTTQIGSYFESRGGKFDTTTFFGLQYALKQYFAGVILIKEDIDEAEEILSSHFGRDDLFYRKGWEHILNKHGGHLPLKIKAVPEGSTIPTHNVLMTVENTDPECYWLPNYVETMLVQNWYPTTVATQSREMKKLILKYLEATGDPSLIDFKLHDFGFRGSTSLESAKIGAAAHSVNFKGSDTLPTIKFSRKFYREPMSIFSIPASEHSTITSWGKENEVKAFENMIDKFGTGMVAVVSDSYDILNACGNLWGDQLKDKIVNMEGSLVIRPDSGYPPEIVIRVLDVLSEKFGTTTNEKGYRVLHPKVRVIQGDGIDYEMIGTILAAMEAHKFSADNIAFGSGGALLQKVNRDTQKFAFKCSWAEINGKVVDVYKDPITDPGKRSKRGKLALIKGKDGTYATSQNTTLDTSWDELQTVFEDGKMVREYALSEIRERASL